MQRDKEKSKEVRRLTQASLHDVEILTVAALEISAKANAPPEVLDPLLDALRELQRINLADVRLS